MQPSSYGAPQTFSGQHGDQGYNDNGTGSTTADQVSI